MRNFLCVAMLVIFSPLFVVGQGSALDIHTDFSPSGSNNSLSSFSQSVSARIPLSKKRSGSWSTGIAYKNLLTGNNTSVINNLWLHSISASLSYTKRTSSKTVMSITAQPSVWSDFKDISGEDIRFNASVHFINRKTNGSSFGWGLSYSYQFFGNQIIPFVDFQFKNKTGKNKKDSIAGTWRIGGALPLRPRLEYVFTRNTIVGLKLEGDFYSYRLSATQFKSQYLFYRQWDLAMYLDQKISGKWFLNAGVGYAFSRSLQIYDKDQTVPFSIFGSKLSKKYTPSFDSQSKGVVFKIGVQMRLSRAEY